MKLLIEHTTSFVYDKPARQFVTEMRLRPASDQHQECLDFRLTLEPTANIYSHRDTYGNSVHFFNNLATCSQREIRATSIVVTNPRYGGSDNYRGNYFEDDLLAQYDFLHGGRFVSLSPAMQKLAESVPLAESGGDDPIHHAETICRYINRSFIYDKSVTDVYTASDAVIELGRGVCQDFAHVALGVCRTLHIPSRYISGYFYGGGQDVTEGASHAWIEVYGGARMGWIGLDPTHDTIWADERYIKIGVGRDYADVPPMRGTYRGGAGEKLSVNVRISTA